MSQDQRAGVSDEDRLDEHQPGAGEVANGKTKAYKPAWTRTFTVEPVGPAFLVARRA